MEKEFSSAKDFSREMQKDERSKTAESLRVKRKEYFTRQEGLKQQLKELLADAEAKKLQALEARTNIENAETKIEQKNQSFVRRILERKQIKRLQTELGTAKLSEQTIAEELAALESAQAELQKSLEDRSALTSAKQELDAFYQQTEQDWNNYEDDRQAGNVKNFMREREAYMVHTFINPTLSPSDENGIIRKELNWQDKLDLLVLEPNLSASAVDKNHPETFAPVGVLIGDGQIKKASGRDMGTRATGVKNRVNNAYEQQARIREQIDKALNTESQGWTEFEVADAKVAGLFFRLDKEGRLDNIQFGSDATMQQIISTAKERHLPLFALREGQFYSISPEEAMALSTPKETKVTERVGLSTYTKTIIDRQKFDTKPERLLSAKAAAELPAGIDDRQREAVLERFMADSPFQLRCFPEAEQVASRAEGRSLYHLYNRENSEVGESDKKEGIIPANAAGNFNPVKVEIFKTIPGPTHLEHYVKLDDGTPAIWRQSRNPISAESRFRAGSTYYQDRLITQEALLKMGQVFVKTEQPPKNVKDIIEAAKAEIQNTVKWTKRWEQEGAELYAERNKRVVKDLAASLYGIAEEAKSAGDAATADLAEKAAAEVYSQADFQDMLARRVSDSGTFKLTREELLGK